MKSYMMQNANSVFAIIFGIWLLLYCFLLCSLRSVVYLTLYKMTYLVTAKLSEARRALKWMATIEIFTKIQTNAVSAKSRNMKN